MKMSGEQLKKNLKTTKHQLLLSVRTWLGSIQDELTQEEKQNWFKAVKAKSSQEMLNSIQTSGLLLERSDTTVVITDAESENQALQPAISKRIYEVNEAAKSRSIMYKLSHITTVFEQLLHLNELLEPMVYPISLEALQVANKQVIHILSELTSITEQPALYASHYLQRSKATHELLQSAKQGSELSVQAVELPLTNKVLQFSVTLTLLTEQLANSFAQEQDNRWLTQVAGYRLRGYLPWHGMIQRVARDLFGSSQISHPDKNSLVIPKEIVEVMVANAKQFFRDPLEAIQVKLNELIEGTTRSLTAVADKLNHMQNNQLAAQQMGALRIATNYLTSPKGYSFYMLTQGLFAAHGVVLSLKPVADFNQEVSEGQERGQNLIM